MAFIIVARIGKAMANDIKLSKKAAAEAALVHVQDGMCVGLGTGTTAALFIEGLGKRRKEEGIEISCVCTSKASETLARKLGLQIVALSDAKKIDMAVDGADQIDHRRNLIKGYGGALSREKVVDYAAEKFIVIADESKLSNSLDKPVPVEALPFCEGKIDRDLGTIGARAKLRLRQDGEPFVSDNGLWIWDADFGVIADPSNLERRIGEIPGVLESGLFTRKVWKVLVAGKDGVVEA